MKIMQDVNASSFLRLNVWGFTVGCAAAALVLGLIAWPLHAMMRHGSGYYGYTMMHGGWFGAWYLLTPLIFAVWAGVAGAIVAAVYNAVTAKRT